MSVTIEEIRSLNDPQRAYKWRVFLPNLAFPNLKSRLNKFTGQVTQAAGSPFNSPRLNATFNEQAQALANGVVDQANQFVQFFNPSLQVKEIQGIPFKNTPREDFYEAGGFSYFPGTINVAPVTLVFYQDASNRIPRYILDWKSKIINRDGTKNLPNEYKFPINIQLLNGQNKVTLDMELTDCFPTITAPYTLTQESEALELTQTFSVGDINYRSIFDIEAALTQDLEDKLSSKTTEFLGNDANFTNLI